MYKVGDGVAHHRLLSYVLKGRNMTTNTTKSTTGYKLWDKIDELKKLSGTKEKLSEDAIARLSNERIRFSDLDEFIVRDNDSWRTKYVVHIRKSDLLDGWLDDVFDFHNNFLYEPYSSYTFVLHYDVQGKDFIIDMGTLPDFLTTVLNDTPNEMELLGDDEIDENGQPTVQLTDKQRNMRTYVCNVTKYQAVLKLRNLWYDHKRKVYEKIDNVNAIIPTNDQLMNFNMTTYARFMDEEERIKNAQ